MSLSYEFTIRTSGNSPRIPSSRYYTTEIGIEISVTVKVEDTTALGSSTQVATGSGVSIGASGIQSASQATVQQDIVSGFNDRLRISVASSVNTVLDNLINGENVDYAAAVGEFATININLVDDPNNQVTSMQVAVSPLGLVPPGGLFLTLTQGNRLLRNTRLRWAERNPSEHVTVEGNVNFVVKFYPTPAGLARLAMIFRSAATTVVRTLPTALRYAGTAARSLAAETQAAASAYGETLATVTSEPFIAAAGTIASPFIVMWAGSEIMDDRDRRWSRHTIRRQFAIGYVRRLYLADRPDSFFSDPSVASGSDLYNMRNNGVQRAQRDIASNGLENTRAEFRNLIYAGRTAHSDQYIISRSSDAIELLTTILDVPGRLPEIMERY